MSQISTRPFGQGDNTYNACGGIEGVRTLVDKFYDAMETLPEAARIRAMHADDLSISRDKLTHFLSGWMGGPRSYREHYGPINIPSAHRHLPIQEEDKDAWLSCMRHALDQQDHYSPELKMYLLEQLAFPAERIVEACK